MTRFVSLAVFLACTACATDGRNGVDDRDDDDTDVDTTEGDTPSPDGPGGSTETCATEDFPAPSAAIQRSCSAAYNGCIAAATTPEQRAACDAAETAECHACIDAAILNCFAPTCGEVLSEYNCCVADGGSSCTAERDATEACWDASSDCRILPSECVLESMYCNGDAESSGTIGGQPLPVHHVLTYRGSGGLQLLFTNAATTPTGEKALLVQLTAIPGQLSYSPASRLARCGVIRKTASGWAPVAELSLCEVQLSALQFATIPNACNGAISGAVLAPGTGEAYVITFADALPVTEADNPEPSCRPYDASCTDNDDCCSESCSPVLGLCQ